MMKISVTGLGKAGLPLSAVIADAGLEVIGIDIDKKRVEMINEGKNPLPEEPGLSQLIEKHGGKSFTATCEGVKAIKNTDFHIVVVPLFLDKHNKPDFSILEAAFVTVGKGLKKNDIVILETTVPVGTTDTFVRKILEKESKLKGGEDFFLSYSPERIMTGYSISRYKEFPKVIGGINKISGEKTLEVYKRFCSNPTLVSNAKTAEMIKISEGAYRDVNIALANELFKMCKYYGIDFNEMRTNANHKYCNIHKAGIGVGGHCIPVYPWFLINDFEEIGKSDFVKLIKTGRFVNDAMVDFWVDIIAKKVKKLDKPINEVKVCIKGISYRPGVKEVAYSRSIALIKKLEGLDVQVFAWDELYSKEEIEKMGLKYSDLDGCDIVFDVFACIDSEILI